MFSALGHRCAMSFVVRSSYNRLLCATLLASANRYTETENRAGQPSKLVCKSIAVSDVTRHRPP